MNLSGNTILITGGATGIGFGLAETLLRQDNRVLICGRRSHRLTEARRKSPELEIFVCDVGTPQGRYDLQEWALRTAPELNVLINNAGLQHKVDLLKFGAERYEEIAVNLEAPIHLSQLFIPHLARRPQPAIVNITSGLAFTPSASVPIYCATKAALHSFTLSLRHQLRGTAIKVFEVAPPLVDSELHNHQAGYRPFLDSMPMAEFVAACLQGLANDVETNAVGFAAGLYEQRDASFSRLNPT
jgi:uncharacterized oxidoreductase